MTLILSALAGYLVLCLYLFATQRSQIYFVTPESRRAGAEALWLDSGDVRLKVWALRRDRPLALVYFGGNAEDVGAGVDTFAARFPAHALYLVNYRGYGGSTGRPTEAGLHADAVAVYDHVHGRHEQVDVMGRSLGAGVAVQLASVRPVRRLVLVTPFDSLARVAQAHFRFLPVSLLMRDRYDAAGRVPAVSAPALLVIAAEDEIIPRARSDALAAAFPAGQARVRIIAGVGHNTLDFAPEYLASVGAFLAAP